MVKDKNSKGSSWSDTLSRVATQISYDDYDRLSDFTNKVPKSRVIKSWQNYTYINGSYVCGLNAANRCLKMWDYSNSISKSQYPYNTVWFLWWESDPYGPYGMQYTRFLKKHFNANYIGWSVSYKSSSSFPWNKFDETNYSNYCVIFLCSWGRVAHYAICIGVSKDKKYYLITDQTSKIWYISHQNLKWLCDCGWIPSAIGGESSPKYACYVVG